MFTQSHILLNSNVLTRKGFRARNIAVLCGAIVPDSDVWIMYMVERIRRIPGCEIFHFRYLEEPWTSVQAALNSFPLYLSLAILSLLTGKLVKSGASSISTSSDILPGMRIRQLCRLAFVFSVSALMHIGIDFLLHHDDARRQFWPLSSWVFESPVSYWDPNYFGSYFVFFEITLGIFLAATLWRKVSARSHRIYILMFCIAYTAPIYASLFGAADHDRGPGSCDRQIAVVQIHGAAVS
jgi:hypothetical protein